MRTRILACLTASLALAALLLPLPAAARTPAERHIQVNARMFAFDPHRVRVGLGDRVTITLVSDDVVHGVFVDGYDVDIQAEPGKPASFVLLQARDVSEAIRLRAPRLKVWRAGRLLAESAPQQVRLDLPGRAAAVDFLRS